MKVVRAVLRLFFIVVLIGCVGIEAYIHGAFDFLEELDTVSSVSELTQYVNEELKKGAGQFDIYTDSLSEEQIKSVNRNMDGFFGSVDTYTILGKKSNGKMKVRMKLKVSDNLYVWKQLEGTQKGAMPEKAQLLYEKVEQILANEIQPGMSDFEKEKAIHDYIVTNCAFAEGYSSMERSENEDVYKAYGALVNGSAVCNGYAEAMYLLMYACGVECRMVIGTADGSDHAWNMVNMEDGWYQVDVTWDDPTPDRKGYVQYDYFNLTDNAMGVSHQWSEEGYPVCEKQTYNYFSYYDRICNSYEEFQNKINGMISQKKKRITMLVENYDAGKYDMSFVVDQHLNIKKASYSTSESAMGTVVTLTVTY